MIAGACASCTDYSYRDNAKEKAAKYLNADNLLRAERHETLQHGSDLISSAEINYWDSLLIEAKSKEAYEKGRQLIIDSLAKNYYPKEQFKPNLDTLISSDMMAKVKNEFAKYVSAEDFIKYKNNAPVKSNRFVDELPYKTHYWNLITLSGRQKEAYNKGLSDARLENNSK